MAQINLPSASSLIDKFLLGFMAFFGWGLATWVNARIPWPH